MAPKICWTPEQEQGILARLEQLRLAGGNGSHSRKDNLIACRGLAANKPYYTFGIRVCEEAIRDSSELSPNNILEMIAAITGCSKDPRHRTGQGYISPHATLRGLARVAEIIAAFAPEGKSFFFGTGHPGCLLGYYQTLASLVQELGGRVVTPAMNEPVKEGGYYIDYIGDVAVMTDEGGLPHTHESEPGMLVFTDCERSGLDIDCAMVDHGWVAGALNHGIQTVAIMDTNDPALALAKSLGAPLDIIPLNDNRPNSIIREAAYIIATLVHGAVSVEDLAHQPDAVHLDNVA